MDMYGYDIFGPVANPGVNCSIDPNCKGLIYYSSSVLNPSLLKYIGYGNTKANLSPMTPYAGLCSYVKNVGKAAVLFGTCMCGYALDG
jgi:hypothetical protein